ncbi:uncharacterized protein LOC125229372 [Leguminivora glycinivorella]|uniref:uncharacterized protein LOC125229372 n=1 Tax=Leguminivora glycinivorella TaxID=1035111 RepID=UPI00200F7B75|nr:uncharacterized protein LOC125229372 [Leguminivora glycinivorella]
MRIFLVSRPTKTAEVRISGLDDSVTPEDVKEAVDLNHCLVAQDLLFQSMAQWAAHVAIISEPYHIPQRDNWAGDHDGSVAVIAQLPQMAQHHWKQWRKAKEYVAVLLGGITVISAYFSPNRSVAEFEAFLEEIGLVIGRCNPRPVLVAGDLNAKSVMWGSPSTNARGRELEEWTVTAGLAVLNRGSVDTCVRQRGGSIVDVTFANAALARRIQEWEVPESVETLSDHRYIRFNVSSLSDTQNGPISKSLPGDGPRWALKRLDREALLLAAEVQAWNPVQGDPTDVEAEAKWLGTTITSICDAAMPRTKPPSY